MSRRNNVALVVLLLLPLVFFAGMFRAEDAVPSAEDEDKIAAKEDAQGDERMVLGEKTVFIGTTILNEDSKPSERGVVGTFYLEGGKNYPLKAASDEVLAQLKKFDQKKITLAGKLRVNGKYLVALSVVEAAPAADLRDKRKRNGL